jgi:acyl-CoA synthetase (NDP forming)
MPRTVAVIGASSDRRKFGNKAVRAFHSHGDTVFPVNPHERVIEGLTAYPSVLAVPGTIDMATMYVPPAIGIRLLDELAQKGVAELWLNPGSESDALVARARALGLTVIEACSITGIGDAASRY